MKKILVLILLASVVFLNSGCKQIKKPFVQPREKEPTVKPVESIELAEVLLKPRPQRITLSADPFMPLVGDLSLVGTEEIELTSDAQLKVVGILSRHEEPLALLEIPTGMAVLRQGDKIGKYQVKKIEPQKVILEKEGQISVLKIREEE